MSEGGRMGVTAAAESSVGRASDPMIEALARAGWAEADIGLAQALSDFAALERRVGQAVRKLRRGGDAALAEDVDASLLMLRQSLIAAARRRGLERFGVVGAEAAFDPMLHECPRGAEAKARVRVLSAGVARAGGKDVVIKAKVAPIAARRRRSA